MDGDTLRFESTSVRIIDIDAPEMDQGFYGELSKYRLERLIGFKKVTCNLSEEKSYDRRLATSCFVGSINIGEYMVRNCLAYGYKAFAYLQCKRMSYKEPSQHRKSRR